jgi:ABC-2 type transport system permease protein
VTGRETITLVARRELRERVRERSFMVSTAINIVIIVAVIIVAALVSGGETTYKVAGEPAVVRAAAQAAGGTDVHIELVRIPNVRAALEDGSIDAAVQGGRIVSQGDPPNDLVELLQAGNNRNLQAPPPLRVVTIEPVDKDADAKSATRSSSS